MSTILHFYLFFLCISQSIHFKCYSCDSYVKALCMNNLTDIEAIECSEVGLGLINFCLELEIIHKGTVFVERQCGVTTLKNEVQRQYFELKLAKRLETRGDTPERKIHVCFGDLCNSDPYNTSSSLSSTSRPPEERSKQNIISPNVIQTLCLLYIIL